MRPTLVLALICGALLTACGGRANDTQAIVDATTQYVKNNSAVSSFIVHVDQVDGDYARTEVTPSDGAADPAWVFLKRQNGQWTALTIGTAFTPEMYRELGIPESLQIR
jgi:hypothetical protein